MHRLILLTGLTFPLFGCGFTPDYWRSSLQNSSEYEVCYAASDMRPGGWAVRREVASQMVKDRGLWCDYNALGARHAAENTAAAAQAAASAQMMQNGVTLMQMGAPQTPAWQQQRPVNTNCRYVGQQLMCTSY